MAPEPGPERGPNGFRDHQKRSLAIPKPLVTHLAGVGDEMHRTMGQSRLGDSGYGTWVQSSLAFPP